jgi:hypothetical protein
LRRCDLAPPAALGHRPEAAPRAGKQALRSSRIAAPFPLCDNPHVPARATNLRLSSEVADLLDRLAALRGLSKTEIVITGILAQAEVFGLIPSLTASLAQLRPAPATDPARRRRQRLSQQRTRARRTGQPVPKLKPGPRRTPKA